MRHELFLTRRQKTKTRNAFAKKNEDVDDFIKNVKSLEDLEVLIDGVAEAIKHAIKNKKADFLLLY